MFFPWARHLFPCAVAACLSISLATSGALAGGRGFRLASAIPTTSVAYVESLFLTSSGGVTQSNTLIAPFDTATNTFGAAIGSVAGYPQAATLSGDGKVLYLTLPFVSSQQQVSTLEGLAVTPTSTTLLGKVSYPLGDTAVAYAATASSTSTTDAFLSTSSASTFGLDTDALSPKKTGPAHSSPIIYVYQLSNGNAYALDEAGNFVVYNAATNAFGKPLAGIVSNGSAGRQVLAVPTTGTTAYALAVNEGSGTSVIDVINPSGPTLTKSVAVPFTCSEIVIDHKGAMVYALGESVADGLPVYTIAKLSTATNTVVGTFTIPDSAMHALPSIAVTPDSLHLLVTSSAGTPGAPGYLDVINPTAGTLLAKVPLPLGTGNAPTEGVQVLTPR